MAKESKKNNTKLNKQIAAGIFLINNDNKLLICHPTNHPLKIWSIPKGKMDKSETPLETALRETYEEANVDLYLCQNIIELPKVNYKNNKKTLKTFLVLENQNNNLNLKNIELRCNSMVVKECEKFPEMDDFKWVSLDDAKKLLHWSHQ